MLNELLHLQTLFFFVFLIISIIFYTNDYSGVYAHVVIFGYCGGTVALQACHVSDAGVEVYYTGLRTSKMEMQRAEKTAELEHSYV